MRNSRLPGAGAKFSETAGWMPHAGSAEIYRQQDAAEFVQARFGVAKCGLINTATSRSTSWSRSHASSEVLWERGWPETVGGLAASRNN